MFAVPFEEIAPIVGAPRAQPDNWPAAPAGCRERLRFRTPIWPANAQVADAFLAAARGGDFDALIAILDPDVVLRADRGAVPAGGLTQLRGAAAVTGRALTSLGSPTPRSGSW
jgi:hypothetical protein